MPRLAERLSEEPGFKSIMITKLLLPSSDLLKQLDSVFIEASLKHLLYSGVIGKVSLEVVRALAQEGLIKKLSEE